MYFASLYPAEARYGLSVARLLKDHARSLAIPIMRLETGVYQEAAIRLYESMGYQARGPFGDYRAGPLNIFYEKTLVGHPAEGQPDHGDG